MAITSGVIAGTDFLVYSDGTAISYSTSCSISITGPGTIPVSTKDSGNWIKKLKKKGYEWTVSADGLLALDGSGIDLREIYNLLRDNSTVVVKFATTGTDDYFFYGDAVATGFNMDAPDNDASTFSCSFEGIDQLRVSTT